jgi:hypothetical protein
MRFIIPLMVLVMAGCGVRALAPVTNDPKDDEKMFYVKPQNKLYTTPWTMEGLEIPNWINDPSIDGKYQAAVGSCLQSNLSLSECKEKAFAAAISEIARSRNVRVKSIVRNYETGDGVSYYDNTAKLESNESIGETYIASTWVQPNTKEYYVWVIVK